MNICDTCWNMEKRVEPAINNLCPAHQKQLERAQEFLTALFHNPTYHQSGYEGAGRRIFPSALPPDKEKLDKKTEDGVVHK